MARKRVSRSESAVTAQAEAQSHTRTQPRDKDATRQRILDAAEEIFAEKGYHGTAVDDIVEGAQTSKGGVYFHFPNKQAIFLALVDALSPRLATAVERAIAGEQNAIAKIDAALHVVLTMFARHRRLSKILLVEAVGLGHGFDEKLMEVRGQFIKLIQRYLDEAVAEGAIDSIDTDIVACAWFGAINEVVVRWLVSNIPENLDDALPSLRLLLLRSVGIVQLVNES
jgi:TetR/AcrR family transcriptional regulator, fatty acid metabolism regulator protein